MADCNSNSNSHIRIAGSVMAALIFLLPLKFGGLAVMPEASGYYPEAWSEWLYCAFPPHMVGVCGAYMLLWALLLRRKLDKKTGFTAVLWGVVPALAALPGWINGIADETLGEIANLLGIGAFTAAAALLIAADTAWAKRFAAALTAGVLCCAFYGIYQYFYGLDELRAFAAMQAEQGVNLSDAMKLKLSDPRIFSTMATSNTLASMLMLAMPPAVYFAWEWGKMFQPEKVSRRLFAAVFLLLLTVPLVMSGSRSAIFCPAVAGMVAVFSLPKIKLPLRLAGAAATAVVLAGGIWFAVICGRSAASMGERADYLRTAAILTARHPFTGSGWGNFFRYHMSLKSSGVAESARDPHNVIAAFSCQAGAIPAAVMAAALLVPLAMLWKKRFSPGLPMAVFWSGVLFSLHSLIDCDWHVPALPAAMGVLYAAAVAVDDPEPQPLGKRKKIAVTLLLSVLLLASAGTNWQYLRGDAALAKLCDRLMPASAEMAERNRDLSVEQLASEARKVRPHSQILWQLEGDWHRYCRNLNMAELCYLKALELDPRRPGILAKLADIAAQRGDKARALELMRQAHELFPKNPRYDVKAFAEKILTSSNLL